MTVGSIVAALVVGLLVGGVGRFLLPARADIPIWLIPAVTVAAALFGSVVARLADIDSAGVSLLEVLVQVGLAGVGVGLVLASTGRRPPPVRR